MNAWLTMTVHSPKSARTKTVLTPAGKLSVAAMQNAKLNFTKGSASAQEDFRVIPWWPVLRLAVEAMTIVEVQRLVITLAAPKLKRSVSHSVLEILVPGVPLAQLKITGKLANVTTHYKEMAIQVVMKVRTKLMLRFFYFTYTKFFPCS